MVVPIRKRRKNAERFIESFASTRELDTRLLLVADDDDDSYEGISLPEFCRLVVIPRTYVVDKVNQFAVPAASQYSYVGNTGDDNVMETQGWDRYLIEPMEKRGHGWSYPDDVRRQDIPENVIISAPIIKALGWFQCPLMRHYWVDHVWYDLAKACGRLFFVPYVTQPHHHYLADPSVQPDETYTETERLYAQRDADAYKVWYSDHFEQDLRVVRGVL